jgi:hypothetical protein
MEPKGVLLVRLPLELIATIRHEAGIKGQTLSEYVKRQLELARKEKRK